MRSLVEIALQNNKERLGGIDVENILRAPRSLSYTQSDMHTPIEVTRSKWNTVVSDNKTTLQRTYTLPTLKHLMYFVDEILEKSHEIDHHPEILISNLEVTVEICF